MPTISQPSVYSGADEQVLPPMAGEKTNHFTDVAMVICGRCWLEVPDLPMCAQCEQPVLRAFC